MAMVSVFETKYHTLFNGLQVDDYHWYHHPCVRRYFLVGGPRLLLSTR